MIERLLELKDKSPYEVTRYTDDTDKSITVELKKPITTGSTYLWVTFDHHGAYQRAGASLSHDNSLEVYYELLTLGLYIHAYNNKTDFGTFIYNRDSFITNIQPGPIRLLENTFWTNTVSQQDKKLISQERDMYSEAVRELTYIYGEGKIPASELVKLSRFTPTYNSYSDLLQELKDLEAQQLMQFKLKGDYWIITQKVEGVNTSKNSCSAIAQWDKPLVVGGYQTKVSQQIVAANKKRLVFCQRSLSKNSYRVVNVPMSVNYKHLSNAIRHATCWDRVFDMYPSIFFARV